MEKRIIHLDLDSFFVSVERLRNTSLRDKPVIIGSMSERGVVASCSYEARKFGVHSAMPMKMARNLCPQAIVIRGDMDLYTKFSRIVTDIIHERAPVYEKASIDEHYLDVSGMDRFVGTQRWANELRELIIRESGLPISMGLSLNKTVSKIATDEAKPNGELNVPKPRVIPFLAPLSIKKIPMIGDKTYRKLRSMGVAQIKTLQEIPVGMMERALGKNGIAIWKKAHGIDNSPVKPYSERKSISKERTFDSDTTDMQHLYAVLNRMVEDLTYQLRRNQQLTSTVTVKIRYSNFDTHTLQKRVSYSAFDHQLLPVVKDLFRRLYSRRMLIRLLGVKFSGLVSGSPQLNLFEDTTEMVNLYKAMDQVKNRYGADAIMHGSAFAGRSQ